MLGFLLNQHEETKELFPSFLHIFLVILLEKYAKIRD